MTDQTIPAEKLRALLDGEGSADDKIQAIYDDLLPAPLPYPLFLAKVTHPEHGEGIVVSHFPDEDGKVQFVFSNDAISDGSWRVWVDTSDLTFHTPDHPEFLESEEDYRSAPEGTIVAGSNASPKVLLGGLWRDIHSERLDHDVMADIRRRVLRWGGEA